MNAKRIDQETELHYCLRDFFRTIESTGGVALDRTGLYRPLADPDWIDLGDAYVRLCHVVGREPLVTRESTDKEE